MNFMSYVAEVSRGWDEPNARDMGRMTSQPNAKGEMYILNDGIDMKARIAAMARRLEELEMTKMQEVQAISQTPLQACAICLSYEHLVEECPTILTVREMFGDCNTYNSNWRDIQNSLGTTATSVMGDFVGAQKSINAHLSQRIDSVESSLNKKMDGVQKKGNFPSQPHQNSKGIYQVEAQKGESSMVKEVKTVITLRSGKEVDLLTSKLEHDEESETEKERGGNQRKEKGEKYKERWL
ncbi:hypothetical protein CK203_039406 [Vitis vinifera]|uniref:Retrotransposon gag domain-containing protein n=1 Tax=Vitis vinifera TaxID=29760 RepID=A0A438I7B4_VITVI|nr:hypothetical protein CK203_039406 [Vitis vinifera]